MAAGDVAPLARRALAEIFGPKAYDYDVLRARLTMFRGPWDAKEWTSYHPHAERLFTAWANGHQCVRRHARRQLAGRIQADRREAGAMDGEDRGAALGAARHRQHEPAAIAEIQLALNVKKFGVPRRLTGGRRRIRMTTWKVPEGLDLNWITDEVLRQHAKRGCDPFLPGRLPPPEIVEQYRSLVPAKQAARLMPELQDMDGSNNWVVSGKLTASGFPILSNDPHRGISLPSLRYFVELDAPGWHVIGGGEPPFVGVDLGLAQRERPTGVGRHLRRRRRGGHVRRADQPGQSERDEIRLPTPGCR